MTWLIAVSRSNQQYAKNTDYDNGSDTDDTMSNNREVEKERNNLSDNYEKKQYLRALLQFSVFALVDAVCEHYQIVELLFQIFNMFGKMA